MYGKIFEQMYHGSMSVAGWEAIVTMQQLIVLANRHGEVDMTPNAISNLTTIPLDIISKGLAILAEPDKDSRSKAEEGRRIVLIDPDRPWGWRLVNYQHYAGIANKQDKREKDAERVAEKRKENNDSQNVANSRDLSQPVANCPKMSRHIDVDVDVVKTLTLGLQPNLPASAKKSNSLTADGIEVLAFLNEKTGRKFRALDGNEKPTANLRIVMDRLKTGITVQDCKTVIARKHREWSKAGIGGSGRDMFEYLRPLTLFRASNFEAYLGQCVLPEDEKRRAE